MVKKANNQTAINKQRIATNAAVGQTQYEANRAANAAAIAAGGVGGIKGSSMPSNYKYTGPSNNRQGLGQVLRIAGGGQGIGRKELKSILEEGGKNVSGGQVVQRLDKINARLAENDLTGINLKSGAANMLTKEAGPAYGGMYGLTQKPMFGTGPLGKMLEGMRGTRATGGYQNPQSGSGEVTAGTKRTILTRGLDLMPSGRQTIRGIGKQYEVPSRLMQPSVAPTTGGPAAGDGEQPATNIAEPILTLEEESPASITEPMSPFQTALANWAQGFRRKQSSRKQAGRGAQGYGSQIVKPPKTNTLGM
jgi:hypothetical protein